MHLYGAARPTFRKETHPMSTLYEQLGGEAAVDAAVDQFYRYVLSDERINYWFDGIDMDKQAAKQKAFLTMAFGGPHNYSGEDMRKGHAHLVEKGLNDSHFDAVAECLVKTLNDLSVPQELQDQVMAIVASTRDDVLGRTPAEA
jgi:hemoglobin